MASSAGTSAFRKGALLLAGGGLYGVTAFFTYSYLQRPKRTPLDDEHGSSCVHSPLRTQQFQKIASTYDSSIGRDELFMGINLLRRSLLYWHAKGTCVEVGAGTGRNLSYYPRQTRVLLTDASDQMLQQAQQKIQGLQSAAERPRFAVVPGDAAHLDLPDQAFDTVVDTFGLCSYGDPGAVLREMVRVCKADGKILLLEHGRSHQWGWVTSHLDQYAEQHAANWGCVWNRDLDALLASVRDVLDVQVLHRWHFGTTYYVVCCPKQQPASQPSSAP